MKTDTVVTCVSRVMLAIHSPKILRNGAPQFPAQAVEAKVAEALASHTHLTTEDGHQRVVRRGQMPERTIQTGIGPVEVCQPRIRDRGLCPIAWCKFVRWSTGFA
jgi:hypothetical protein